VGPPVRNPDCPEQPDAACVPAHKRAKIALLRQRQSHDAYRPRCRSLLGPTTIGGSGCLRKTVPQQISTRTTVNAHLPRCIFVNRTSERSKPLPSFWLRSQAEGGRR